FAEGAYTVRVPWARMRKALDPNGPLKPVLAQESASGSLQLNGTVLYRERIALPPNAQLVLQVVAATIIPQVPIINKQIPAKNPSIRFTVVVQTGLMDVGQRYVLKARLMVEGKTWFENADPIEVPRTGWKTAQEIVLQKSTQSAK